MEEIATVIKKNENKAELKIIRYSACSKCDISCSLAGDNHDQKEMILEVEDKIGAEKGDQVLVEMKEKNLILATLLIYLGPIIFMILGYFIGLWFAARLGFEASESAGIMGTVIFLILSFLLNKSLNSFWGQNSDFQPKIKKIINK